MYNNILLAIAWVGCIGTIVMAALAWYLEDRLIQMENQGMKDADTIAFLLKNNISFRDFIRSKGLMPDYLAENIHVPPKLELEPEDVVVVGESFVMAAAPASNDNNKAVIP